jgi:hypothetical protein
MAEGFQAAARFVLMSSGRIDLTSKTVTAAVAKYEAMEAALAGENRASLADSFTKALGATRGLHPPEVLPGRMDGYPQTDPGDPAEGGLVDPAGVFTGSGSASLPKEFDEANQIIGELEAAEQADMAEYRPVTTDDLWRVHGLWQECQQRLAEEPGGEAAHRRKPPVLVPIWENSPRPAEPSDAWGLPAGEDLPPEMDAPDFGWQLARSVAACRLRAELPAEDAFFWIRLAAGEFDPAGKVAAGDEPCRRALRLAMDLHRRPHARLLLQAALLTRDAEMGGVAAFLALDPRVVAAYATLFFNVPGRNGDDGFRQDAIRNFASDFDRVQGVALRPGEGLAKPLLKAPEVTLDQLQWLLGFRSPDEQPADAARRLLRYLSALAPGRGTDLVWDEGKPRKPGRPAGAGRKNPRSFEDMVESAGGMMVASHYGMAAIMSGIGPFLAEPLRKAVKIAQHHRLMQTYIDSGLTPEQAEERLHAAKDERRAEERRNLKPSNSATRG